MNGATNKPNGVSIPKRVTAKVELNSYFMSNYQQSVSIPKRVTAKVEHHNLFFCLILMLFQSLKGLQPKWNFGT